MRDKTLQFGQIYSSHSRKNLLFRINCVLSASLNVNTFVPRSTDTRLGISEGVRHRTQSHSPYPPSWRRRRKRRRWTASAARSLRVIAAAKPYRSCEERRIRSSPCRSPLAPAPPLRSERTRWPLGRIRRPPRSCAASSARSA